LTCSRVFGSSAWAVKANVANNRSEVVVRANLMAVPFVAVGIAIEAGAALDVAVRRPRAHDRIEQVAIP
jgi:hypothetical protein